VSCAWAESAHPTWLIAEKGGNFSAKVYLEVINKTTGQAVTIITDGLTRVGKSSFEYEEAKFSGVQDLSNSSVNLRSSFTANQKLATDWLSEGNATVRLKNSQGGRQLFGDSFKVGTEINLSQKVNVYVNSPKGIVKRTYP
jgi:predicted S18 family serine protease